MYSKDLREKVIQIYKIYKSYRYLESLFKISK